MIIGVNVAYPRQVRPISEIVKALKINVVQSVDNKWHIGQDQHSLLAMLTYIWAQKVDRDRFGGGEADRQTHRQTGRQRETNEPLEELRQQWQAEEGQEDRGRSSYCINDNNNYAEGGDDSNAGGDGVDDDGDGSACNDNGNANEEGDDNDEKGDDDANTSWCV